jgi:hypothetical protein
MRPSSFLFFYFYGPSPNWRINFHTLDYPIISLNRHCLRYIYLAIDSFIYNQLQPYSGWSQIPNGKSLDFWLWAFCWNVFGYRAASSTMWWIGDDGTLFFLFFSVAFFQVCARCNLIDRRAIHPLLFDIFYIPPLTFSLFSFLRH